MISNIGSILLLVFGFGFVIFFHELGHFLAAKWVGIRVEQFAVGFGQALVAWRKGIGYRVGSTAKEMEARIAKGESPSNFGETEYRLNWIPLGGYVKMLGQDDMKPGAEIDDPHAYNRKSVGARMVVVSAGVIMNIILAAIGFMIVFRAGLNAPPAVVGSVQPGSPAAMAIRESDGKIAPLQVGDRILYFDDKYQHDFTKVSLSAALAEEGAPVPLLVKRVDGSLDHLMVSPRRPDYDPRGLLMMGVGQADELRGPKVAADVKLPKYDPQVSLDDSLAVHPDETIMQINGEPVKLTDIDKLDRAIQASNGEPVEATVADEHGATRKVAIRPRFQMQFGKKYATIAGFLPRPMISLLSENSPAKGKILPGDIILAVSASDTGDAQSNPTETELRKWLNEAGQKSAPVNVRVLRDGKEIDINGIKPIKIDKNQYGLNVGLEVDAAHPIVAGTVADSPAARAGVPTGAVIKMINDEPVSNWFQIKHALEQVTPEAPVKIQAMVNGETRSYIVNKITRPELAEIAASHLGHNVVLNPREELRKAPSVLTAAGWGVTETRDFVLQFYLTLKRMFQGSVSPANMMGPLGIFHAGALFAFKGTVWLIWFLSMISANLAVVNFLPIPIVDGGLFTFLIIEKILGKPISARAQSIAQVVGLAIILGVFLLVTYQDVMRLPFLNH